MYKAKNTIRYKKSAKADTVEFLPGDEVKGLDAETMKGLESTGAVYSTEGPGRKGRKDPQIEVSEPEVQEPAALDGEPEEE